MRIPGDTDAVMRTIQRHWERQQEIVASSSARIATGSRLVGAVDDTAGVAIAQRVRAQFESMRQASRNAQEGVNFVHIAQSSLMQSTDLVQRMRVMALQSANGTFSDDQRAYLQRAVLLTLDELDALAQRTATGDVDLLDGSRAALRVQTGPDAGDALEVTLRRAGHGALGLDALSVATQGDAVSALDRLDEAITVLNEHRAQMAAARARMERMVTSLGASEDLTRAIHSRISDADIAEETVRMLRAQIASDAGAAMMVQVRHATQLVLNLLLPEQVSPSDTDRQGKSERNGAAMGADAVSATAAMVTPSPVTAPVTAPVPAPTASVDALVAASPMPPSAARASTATQVGERPETPAESGVSGGASTSVTDGRWGARTMV